MRIYTAAGAEVERHARSIRSKVYRESRQIVATRSGMEFRYILCIS